jgi:cystathionine gamma-synthase
MAVALDAPKDHPVGEPIPPYTDHAISVSLPTWEDNVGYEEGDPRVVDTMQTGYPRFFIHKRIVEVRCPLWSFIEIVRRLGACD